MKIDTTTLQGKKACFFVKTNDPSIIERNEFYRVDLNILADLGLEIKVVTDIRSIPNVDIYVVWWWTWAFVPLIRAKLLGKPVVIVGTFDHVMPDGNLQVYPHRPRLHQSLIRWALRASTTNVVCAEDQRQKMLKMFKSSPIEVSPHVLDTDIYKPGSEQRQSFFLTVCWMNKDNAIRKCVATSIRAMVKAKDQIPGFKLIIAGDKGDGYPALAELVAELGAEDIVEFVGVVSQETKVKFMQTCTAYLQPTLVEGFGVAILEGMSCGAPVIVSPVGGVPSVVGKCALFVDGMDPVGLAKAMCAVATNSELSAGLSLKGRERAVSKFSYDRRLSDFRRILGQAIL